MCQAFGGWVLYRYRACLGNWSLQNPFTSPLSWCFMELKDHGGYLTIASWHFLELQDSTELGLRQEFPFSVREL